MTPYNHSTHTCYNEFRTASQRLIKCLRRGCSNSVWLNWFWLLQMIPPSAFSGERCFSWVLHSKSSMWCSSLWWKQSLCRCLHLGWIPGDRCCAPLDPFCVSSLVDSTLLLGCWDHSFVPQTHLIEVSGSRRTELTRSCQGPPLKSEWQKVGSNSGPTAPEARTLPLLHAPFL